MTRRLKSISVTSNPKMMLASTIINASKIIIMNLKEQYTYMYDE